MSTLKEICKEQTEMIDEMRQNIKELTEENEKLSEQYNKMLEERNSLIDDLSWYKAKVSRLEDELKDFDNDYEMVTNNCIYWEDKAHWLEQRISKLVSENTKLQNDLFSEQLIQDEADDKIKKLERENAQFKEKNGELQEVIEGKNSDILLQKMKTHN